VSETMTLVDNPYWDAVKERVSESGSLWRTPTLGGLDAYRNATGFDVERWAREAPRRTDYVRRYSWTVTDPETVAFVAEHSRGRLVDPMAGTGYWGWLLAQLGVDVVSYDLNPPEPGAEDNIWHRNSSVHSTVLPLEAVESVKLHGDRTLLLSWPPYGFPAEDVLGAFAGDRLVYIGEDVGGCCADDAFFEHLESHWVEVAERVPVQWDGMHDVVKVYDRRSAS
jgi:hypothetical protein